MIKRALYHNAAAVVRRTITRPVKSSPARQTALSLASGTGTGPGGYPGTGPSDNRGSQVFSFAEHGLL